MKRLSEIVKLPKFEVLAENIVALVKVAIIEPTPQISHLNRITEPTDPILEKLGACESSNSPDKIILDTNGYYSYGLLQFQLRTFMSYGIEYGLLPDTITTDQARDLIMSPKLQKQLATEMLKEKDGWRHWTNCYKQISLK